jgi:hypothetical protein
MDQDKDQERKQDCQSDEAMLLTLSNLEYVGVGRVATAYVWVTGRDDQPCTIVAPLLTFRVPVPVMLQRHIRQVSFLWDEATLTLMMVLNSAFDMSPFTDLVDTMNAMHTLQTIYGLMF